MLELWKIRHPWYDSMESDWRKFRLVYEGGDRFIEAYLKQFSKREDNADYCNRKEITYCPNFVGSAVDDIKNSIYQRMVEITRVGGDKTYQKAVAGTDGGVDLEGGSMNNFIGQDVLPELITMGRVGIYVDAPQSMGITLADLGNKKPYLYIYTAEQIPSWNSCYDDGEKILTHLILKETYEEIDEESGLVKGENERIRKLTLTDAGVLVEFYDKDNKLISSTMLAGMKRIPFVIAEISHSLIKDVANYQIALLNMESADINYILKANFPFYVEQYDPRSNSPHLTPGYGDGDTGEAQKVAEQSKEQEIAVGPVSGRRVPFGVSMPLFIHPSSEPLKASMEKQARMKADVRNLVNLALSSLEPMHASAESKGMDSRSLESGLSYIGLELERVEKLIGEAWASYMNSAVPTVKYPRKYSLKSDKDRRDDSEQLSDLMGKVPSKKYAKAVGKELARTLLEQKVSDEELQAIFSEIDKAEYITSDADAVNTDVQAGLVSKETASNARGYDGAKEVPIANKEHAERLALIAKSQMEGGPNGARGVPDASANPKDDADKEKAASQRNTDTQSTPKDKVRGEGK